MDQWQKEKAFDPRRGNDRIEALLSSFTSSAGDCPFYDKYVRSTCKLDPTSRRVWDCKGICFCNGFCCNQIIYKSTEIEELRKIFHHK